MKIFHLIPVVLCGFVQLASVGIAPAYAQTNAPVEAAPPPPTPKLNSPADFTIHSLVVAPNPPRVGINVQGAPGGIDITDNIWTADGAFSPMNVRMNFTIDDGTAHTVAVTSVGTLDYYNSILSGYFDGASTRIYRFDGKASGIISISLDQASPASIGPVISAVQILTK